MIGISANSLRFIANKIEVRREYDNFLELCNKTRNQDDILKN